MFDLLKNVKNSERFVLNRRSQDQISSVFKSHVADDILMREKAFFSQKADKIGQKQHYLNEKERFESLRQSDLDEKRKKLKNMLDEEMKEYRSRMGTLGAGQNREQGLKERIENMRADKEARRRDLADMLYDRQFKNNNWDYREIMRERDRIEQVKELQGQICQKQEDMLREYTENGLYVELDQRLQRKKAAEEDRKYNERREKTKSNARIIDLQRMLREKERDAEKETQAKEQSEIKEILIGEINKEKENNNRRRMQEKERLRAIFEENEKQEKKKMEKQENKKIEDKMWVEDVLRREKDAIDAENNYRIEMDNKKKNFIQNTKPVDNFLDQQVEKYIEEENKKKWHLEDQNWAIKEEKRLKLLLETYESRKNALLLKKQAKDQSMQEKMKERKELDKKVIESELQEETMREQAFEKEKNNKNAIISQSVQRKQLLQRKKELEELERKLLEGNTKDIQSKLAFERQINKGLVLDLRKSYPL